MKDMFETDCIYSKNCSSKGNKCNGCKHNKNSKKDYYEPINPYNPFPVMPITTPKKYNEPYIITFLKL